MSISPSRTGLVAVMASSALIAMAPAPSAAAAADSGQQTRSTDEKPAGDKTAETQRPGLGATTPSPDEASATSGGPTRLAPPPTGDTTVNRSAPAPPTGQRPALGATTPPPDEAAGEPSGPTPLAPPPSPAPAGGR
jgi:hypothetical protein